VIAGDGLDELSNEETDFNVAAPTVDAGNLFEQTRIVQVHQHGIILLNGGKERFSESSRFGYEPTHTTRTHDTHTRTHSESYAAHIDAGTDRGGVDRRPLRALADGRRRASPLLC
jgi:hypothetical protein